MNTEDYTQIDDIINLEPLTQTNYNMLYLTKHEDSYYVIKAAKPETPSTLHNEAQALYIM